MTRVNHLNLNFWLGDEAQANKYELMYPILGAFIILLIRYSFMSFVLPRIGIWFGLRDIKRKKPSPNDILEAKYAKSKKWNSQLILGLSKRLDMNEEQIQEWLYLRTVVNRPTTLEKFINSAWHFIYYTIECTCGFIAIWDKPWIWNLDLCWEDGLNQAISSDTWWYFMLCLSFGWSQLVTAIYGVKKKDFYINVVHHIAYIVFMSLSWSLNAFRIISIIILVSDFPDVFLEASKTAKYIGLEKTAITVFLTFAVMWIVVRLALHPLWLMKNFVVDAPRIVPILYETYQYYIISGLLIVFVILNCLWTYFVIQAVLHIFVTGRGQDSRSDSDE